MALMNPSLGEPDGGDAEYEAAVASGDLQKLFSVLEREQGLPAGYLRKTAQIESRMNPAARNPRSSAGGLFQQLDSNARQYGVQDKFDPVQSALGAAMFAGDNADVLMRTLGREPTAGELYLAHQQGAGGATKLLANPNAPASSIVGDAAARLNGGAGKTAGQLAKTWTSKLDGAADLPATDAIPVSMDTGEKGFAVPGAGLMNRTPEAYQPAKQDNLLRNAVMALGQSIASGKRGDYTGGFSTSLNALQASDEKRDDRRYDMWRDQRNFGQTVAESQRAQGNTDRNFDLQKTSNEIALKREGRADELERERIGLARKADTRAEAAASEKNVSEVDRRTKEAEAFGLTGERRANYILNGKYQGETPTLTADDRKAIREADATVESSKSVLGHLKEAMDLSKQAYEGPTASARGMVTGLFGSDAGKATQNLDNVVQNNALTSLKSVFGGNPTEGERKILLDVAGSSSKPESVRQDIFKRAYEAAERRIVVNQERAGELRGGSYYRPGGGQVSVSAPVQGATSAPPAAAVSHLRQNPDLKAAFDAKFGAGAADRALGGP